MCYLSYHSPLNEVNTGLIEGYSGDHAGSDAIFIVESYQVEIRLLSLDSVTINGK